VLRLRQVAPARQLIALLAVLAAAPAIGLPGDDRIAAALPSDATGASTMLIAPSTFCTPWL
jgi:hypothetical protein